MHLAATTPGVSGAFLDEATRPAINAVALQPADLAHVWPLQHARIIPNGTYFMGWPNDETNEVAPA